MNKINKINLRNLELKTLTEQDVLDYCQLNNINLDNITVLNLNSNKLTDISGIKLFKNLKSLYLQNNELTDISVIQYLNGIKILNIENTKIKDISVFKYLTKLEYLNINYLNLESDQIKYINSLKNLEFLICGFRGFKDRSVLKKINENITLE